MVLNSIEKLLEKYDNRVEIALSHYNGGSAVNMGGGNYQIIPATKKYVDKVLAHRQNYLTYADSLALQAAPKPLVFAQVDNYCS